MKIRVKIAKLFGQTGQKIIRTFNGGRGETAPGLIALYFDPEFISHSHQDIQTKIIISGTNGKTTTTSLVSNIFKNSSISFITNSSGSNLLRGISAALLNKKPDTKVALWEADEAALVQIAKQVKPTHLILTNLFRDQLDRYGEIDSTFKKWLELLKQLPRLTIFLNADDPNLAYLGSKLENHEIIYFGLNNIQNSKKKLEASADAIFCPICNLELVYSQITYSHLGKYSCSCGFSHPKLNFCAENLKLTPETISFSIDKQTYNSNLFGIYNVYNAIAAIILTSNLGIDKKIVKKTLTDFKPAFGRQEVFMVNNKRITMLLVKNPTGFNEVINSLQTFGKKLTVCIAINDQIADGKDVSWLWDVDFEEFLPFAEKVIVTGDRALDMGVRLKYAGFNEKQYLIEPQFEKALNLISKEKDNNIFILPTYTAMWEMRQILLKA